MQALLKNTRRRSYIGVVAGFFIFFVGINFPLALVMQGAGLRAAGLEWQSARGTLWQGRIAGASYQNYPIGDLDVQVAFLPLLSGKLQADVAVRGAALNADGEISVRAGQHIKLKDVALVMDLGKYNIRDLFESKMAGNLRLDISDLEIKEQSCARGEFTLWTDTLIYSARRYGGEGFPVSGDGFCEAGVLVLPLSGKGATEELMLEATLQQDFDYTANVQVRSQTPGLSDVLRLYGFEKREDRLTLIQRGNLLVNEF